MLKEFELPTENGKFGDNRQNETLIYPFTIPKELSDCKITFQEYRNIVITCKEEIDSRKTVATLIVVPFLIAIAIAITLYFTKVFGLVGIIVSIVILAILFSISFIAINYYKFVIKFNNKINAFNKELENRGIKIIKKSKFTKNGHSIIKIYISYTSKVLGNSDVVSQFSSYSSFSPTTPITSNTIISTPITLNTIDSNPTTPLMQTKTVPMYYKDQSQNYNNNHKYFSPPLSTPSNFTSTSTNINNILNDKQVDNILNTYKYNTSTGI